VDTQTFAEAQPRYVGDGQYTFQLPSDNGFIHAVDPESGQPTGKPFVFDMRGALESGDIQPGARLEGTIDVLGVELDVQGRQGPPEVEGGRPEGPGPAGPGRRGGERARQEGDVTVGRPQPAGDAGAGGAGPGGRGLDSDGGEVSGGSGPSGRGLGGGARQDQLQPQPGVTEQTGRVSGSRSLFEPTAQQQQEAGGDTPPTPGTRPVTTPTPEFNPFRSSEAPLRARDNTVPKPPPEPDVADLSVPKPRRGQGLQQLVALAPDLQVTGDGELQVPDAVVQAEIEPPRAPNAEGRGVPNNNPMNLAFSNQPWLGKGPPDQKNLTEAMPEKGFETFRNPVLGIRAGAQDLLASQLQKDQRTLRGIMREFTQTDRESYVSFLSDRLGVSPTDRIDLTNPNTLVETVKGIIEFENGTQPYKESTIATGVAMGFSAKKEAGQF